MNRRNVFITSVLSFSFLFACFILFFSKSDVTSSIDNKFVDLNALQPSPANTSSNDQPQMYSANAEYVGSPPQPVVEPEKPSQLVLWDRLENVDRIESDGVAALQFHVDPTQIDKLAVGQKIHLATPQSGGVITALIEKTRNQLSHVQVWQGQIDDGDPGEHVIITRGKSETHIIVSTLTGTTTTIINNVTGVATMVDEADVLARQNPIEDGITVPPVDDTPPEHLTQLTEFHTGEVQ